MSQATYGIPVPKYVLIFSLLLSGCYPARLKKVLIVTAPLWFKAPFKVLRKVVLPINSSNVV